MVLLTLRLNSLCSLQLLRKRRLFLLDQGLQLFPVFIQKAHNDLAGLKESGMEVLIQVGIHISHIIHCAVLYGAAGLLGGGQDIVVGNFTQTGSRLAVGQALQILDRIVLHGVTKLDRRVLAEEIRSVRDGLRSFRRSNSALSLLISLV